MRIATVLLLSVLSTTLLPQIRADDSDASGIESLGLDLLDDLTPDVLRLPSRQKHVAPPRAPRFDDLGEDIGQPSGPLVLARVRQTMQHAESLLSQEQSGREPKLLHAAVHAQQQVVDKLDELIAELSKQCQSGNCSPNDQSPNPSQSALPKPTSKNNSAATRGQTAARDSVTQLGESQATATKNSELDAVLKNLWGHLPERGRQQMLQTFSDEFLPEYEQEIEQYYRRLSEEK